MLSKTSQFSTDATKAGDCIRHRQYCHPVQHGCVRQGREDQVQGDTHTHMEGH